MFWYLELSFRGISEYSIEKLYWLKRGTRISNWIQFSVQSQSHRMIVAFPAPVKKSIASNEYAMHFNGKLALIGTNFENDP